MNKVDRDIANLPDTTVSVREKFGFDSKMVVPAYSVATEHVPDFDPDYLFDEATTLAGGPVFLAVEELPGGFETPDAAEAAVPDLYGSGLYELIWRDGAWRVTMRYWRPAPPAPVARTGDAAAKKPLGHARTPEDARTLLGAPAELTQEMMPNRYVDHKQLMKRWGEWVKSGLAEIVETEGKFAVRITYWRPMHAPGAAAHLTSITPTANSAPSTDVTGPAAPRA